MGNHSAAINFVKTFLMESGLPGKDFTISMIKGDGSVRLFQRLELHHNHRDKACLVSADAGSKKPYQKPEIQHKHTFIFMQNPPYNDSLKKENLAYLNIGNHMLLRGIPLPRILKHNLEKGYFIMEDMGERTLQDEALISSNRIKLYENIVETLVRLQINGREDFDISWCCQTPFYDASLMREREAWYFRDAFLRDYIKTESDLSMLDEPFEFIISMAEKADKDYLLHRDFQSRNIMCMDKEIAILDWQGARLGPLAYDLASLIYDPYVDLSPGERQYLTDVYASLLEEIKPEALDSFKRYFFYIAVMRNLQVLGAYSFLSLKQGKKQFEKYIPAALKSLKTLFNEISHKNLSPLLDIVNSLGE